MRLDISLFTICTLLAGCVTVPPVDEAKSAKPFKVFWWNCSKPCDLSRDCESGTGLRRRITLNSIDLFIAGSDDGRTVVFSDVHWFKNNLKSFPLWNAPPISRANNAAYAEVASFLKSKGISIIKARPIVEAGDIAGYIVELDADGYGFLRRLAKP